MSGNLHDIPEEQHWAIITTSQIHHEGDERSRTNPGHGYPAYSETVISYQAFDDEHEWKHEIGQLETRKAAYRAMKVFPANVSTSVNVVVNFED